MMTVSDFDDMCLGCELEGDFVDQEEFESIKSDLGIKNRDDDESWGW